mgnify:CR=1 FL=1
MRDCIRAANFRSSSVMYVTMPMTTFRTTNGATSSMIHGGIAARVIDRPRRTPDRPSP